MAARIDRPYLLVLFSVRFHVDAQGRRCLDPLWARDLARHAGYIAQLTLAAPRSRVPPAADFVVMDDDPRLAGVRRVELAPIDGWRSLLATLPGLLRTLWREVGRAAIVHTAVAGWPLPEAWLLLPIARLRGRPLYINVESAFWRLVPGQPANWRRRLRARVVEAVNRFCLAGADISTYTHDGYRRSLLARPDRGGHVVEASWIDAADIVGEGELASVLAGRDGRDGLRVVFAGRLNAAKGVEVLLDAAEACRRAGVDVRVDVYGEGSLAARVAALAPAAQVRLCGSLPYGRRFFEVLRHYDVMVVPSLSDEQPRVVFDAYSQALPVIASRTAGLVQCVAEGVTGWLFEPGDATALQRLLARAAGARGELRAMAAACRSRAAELTHERMHERRRRLLVEAFPELATAGAGAPAA